MTIFRVVHEQSLEIDAQNQVTEIRPWARVELGYEAIQTGWFSRFKPNWIDLAVLEVIGLHARPLRGEDFKQLSELGLVGPDDQGRLYARITDVAVADILGATREWLGKCAVRLGEKGLLRVLPLPKQFRDSRGHFSGNSAYLLSGQVLVHSTHNRVNSVHMADLDRDRVNSIHTADLDRVNSIHTVDPDHVNSVNTAGLAHVNSVHTKYITLSSTLSKNESGSRGDPAADHSAAETVLVPGNEHAGDRLALDRSGNVAGADRAENATKTASGVHRSQGTIWQQLNAALEDEKVARAFEPVLAEIESSLGFTEIGLRAARLAFAPLPEHRRRVLDDLRRMQGNAALKPSARQRNVIGILTQNIGVVLGLGLTTNGGVRVLADRADYTALGGLVKQYGAELLWLTACDIAGQGFEGDPIDYLRAALRNKRERDKAGASARARPRGPSGLGSFDDIDYTKEQVGV